MIGTQTQNYAQLVFFEAVELFLRYRNCFISVYMFNFYEYISLHLTLTRLNKDANCGLNVTFSLHPRHGFFRDYFCRLENLWGADNGEVSLRASINSLKQNPSTQRRASQRRLNSRHTRHEGEQSLFFAPRVSSGVYVGVSVSNPVVVFAVDLYCIRSSLRKRQSGHIFELSQIPTVRDVASTLLRRA